jgi:class 3 adenylate cyclase
VAFSAGWDRRDQWTLRFADPTLERSYRYADHADVVRRTRTASLVATVVWLAIALIAPTAVGTAPAPVWLICAGMIVVCLVCVGLGHWATTPRRRDAIGVGQQLAAGIAVLVLVTVTGTFPTYGMPGIMLTAVFAFSITRIPFLGSVALGSAYSLLFAAFALALGLGAQLPLQAFLVVATVAGGCVGAFLLEQSQRAAFAQGQLVAALHQRVDQLLHQYLSPDVATALIEDPRRSALGGEEVEVTVLFADLRGYTTWAERATPTEVVAMLNGAFGAVVPIVLAEGGAVVQFIGDAIMAIFNAPTRQADHALRAARAALAMQRAIADLPGARLRPQFRVGLNSGPALVGNIGAAQMRNFSAIGDTTNLAARLQTYAREGSVVIGASTYELIRDVAVVRPLGAPQLKGKMDAVEVYELLELRSRVEFVEVAHAT